MARGRASVTTQVTESRLRLASVSVPVLGAAVVLMAAVLLAFLTSDLQLSRDGATAPGGLACGLVGCWWPGASPATRKAGS